MPITTEDFQTSRQSKAARAMRDVYAFLKAHPHLAYSITELSQEFGLDQPYLEDVLEEMEFLRSVESKDIDGAVYYRAAGPLSL